MTFQPTHQTKSSLGTQAGVTLMLAVLILSAIIAVAFSLATIVFIEIRSSGDVLRTEPALYATLGVTEEALFQYKRFVDPAVLNVPSCTPAQSNNTTTNICNINTVVLTMPGTQPVQYDDSPKVMVVPAGQIVYLPMYLSNNIYTQQYTDVKVELLPIGDESDLDLGVNFTRTKHDGTVDETVLPGNPKATAALPFYYNGFDATDGQYDLILDNSANPDNGLTVSITTNRVGDAQPAGLPFVGEAVMRVMANYLGLTRTYQVRIPIP